MKDKRSAALERRGRVQRQGGMKPHSINIHEPSHLSEHNSSVRLAVNPWGRGEEKEGRKEGCRSGMGWVRGVAVAEVPQSFPFVKRRHDALGGLLLEP